MLIPFSVRVPLLRASAKRKRASRWPTSRNERASTSSAQRRSRPATTFSAARVIFGCSRHLHALSAADHFDLLPLHIRERNDGLADTSILDKHGSGGDHDISRGAADNCSTRMASTERGCSLSKRIHIILLGRGYVVDSAAVLDGWPLQ